MIGLSGCGVVDVGWNSLVMFEGFRFIIPFDVRCDCQEPSGEATGLGRNFEWVVVQTSLKFQNIQIV